MERFIWATSLLELKPFEKILEIGCGTGIFAEQIANKLVEGKIVAIDKSESMIQMAAKRNKQSIDKGMAEFSNTSFKETAFNDSIFDKIVAFNVNLFWKGSKGEYSLIQKYLKKEGKLYIFYQTPSGLDLSLLQRIKERMIENGFPIHKVVSNESIGAFCIVTLHKDLI